MESESLLARGRTAEIYRWGADRVLKLFFDSCPESAARQEARVTRAVHAAGLPAPAVVDMVEVEGRLGIVFERVEGHPMLTEFRTRPWKLVGLSRTLAELQSEVHRREVPGLPSFGASLQRRIREQGVLPSETQRAVLELLERLRDGNALCHGDFHPDNILMTARGPVILDWMTACQGNPLADVARTSVILRVAGSPPGATLPAWMLAASRVVERIYRQRALELHRSRAEELAAWTIPVAAARLAENIPGEQEKLLAIVEHGLR